MKASLFEKDLPESERVFYYEDETVDPVKTKEQEQKGPRIPLDEGYVFIHKNPFYRVAAWCLYYLIFYPFVLWYLKFYLHGKIIGRKNFKKVSKNQAYVIYPNHTKP